MNLNQHYGRDFNSDKVIYAAQHLHELNQFPGVLVLSNTKERRKSIAMVLANQLATNKVLKPDEVVDPGVDPTEFHNQIKGSVIVADGFTDEDGKLGVLARLARSMGAYVVISAEPEAESSGILNGSLFDMVIHLDLSDDYLKYLRNS